MDFNYVSSVFTLIYAQGSLDRWPQEEVYSHQSSIVVVS